MATGSLAITPVTDTRTRDLFLRVPYVVHGDDPTWVPPLLVMDKDRINPEKGPFFKFGEARLFVATRDGAPVGRVSAQINRHHLERHKDGAGHFGFFDCLDDQEAADALLAAAADWLRAKGMTKMVGPFNFSVNEEIGLQIEGFDTPPAVFMTQARPWTAGLLERAGFAKETDLLAYRVSPDAISPRAKKLTDFAHANPRLTLRSPDMKRKQEELALLVDIFNDSWSENWSFSPLSAHEVEAMLGEFTRFIKGQFCRFVMLDGEPVGVMVFMPNYNEPLLHFGGKLLPFNWAKLVYALITDRFRSGRVIILGIRKSVQGTALSGQMVALLTNEIRLQASGKYDWAEFGWVLEGNKPMVRLCEMCAGRPVKRYRMFGKAI